MKPPALINTFRVMSTAGSTRSHIYTMHFKSIFYYKFISVKIYFYQKKLGSSCIAAEYLTEI